MKLLLTFTLLTLSLYANDTNKNPLLEKGFPPIQTNDSTFKAILEGGLTVSGLAKYDKKTAKLKTNCNKALTSHQNYINNINCNSLK